MPITPMTPIRALVYAILGLFGLMVFIGVIGAISGQLDYTTAFGVCGTVLTGAIGVLAVRMAAESKDKDRGDKP